MSLVVRIALYLPILYLIAIVIMAQHHTTAGETLRAAGRRALRWVGWTVCLLGGMFALEAIFIAQ